MDKKTLGIILTVVTGLVCGCPGLIGLCAGPIFVFAGLVPGSDIDIMGSSDPAAAITTGIITLVISIIFVAVPIVVGFMMLRNKPEDEIIDAVAAEEIPNGDL